MMKAGICIVAFLAILGRALAGTPTVTLAKVGEQTHFGTTDSITATVTFSEAVGDSGSGDNAFVSSDITLANCDLATGGFVETTVGTVWTLTLEPTGTSACTIDIDAASATSTASGDDNTAATQLLFAFRPKPTITTTSVNGAAPASAHDNTHVTIAIEFTHSVTSFISSDLVVSHGSLAGFSGSGTSYTVTLNPAGGTDGSNGDITISVPAGRADGPSSSTNAASGVFTLVYGPSVVITTDSGDYYHDGTAAIALDIALSEGITDAEFTDADWTASGCTISDTTKVSATAYTANATPTGTGTCSLSIAAGKFTGATSSDANVATASATDIFYGIPTVAISTTDDNIGTHDGSSAIGVQVTFGAPVGTSGDGTNDFAESDITINEECSISSFTEATGSNANKVWTFDITPSDETNCQLYVAGGKATGTNGGLWNTASNIMTFVYTEQWGLVSGNTITSDAARGALEVDAAASGATTTFTLQNHKFGSDIGTDTTDGIEVCLSRSADASLSAASLAGSLTIELTLEAGITDVFINADEDDGATGSGDNKFTQTLADGALSDGGSFQLKWGDAETGDRCFYISRTAWVTAALQSCQTSAASFDFTVEAVDVSADSECTSGGDESECGVNARYFTNAMSTITIARSTDVLPTVQILAPETLIPLFDASDAPPHVNSPLYAQDEPKALFAIQRECNQEYSTATDTASSFYGVDIVVDFEDMLLDVAGATGIKSGSNYDFYDVTDTYVDTDTTWTEMRDVGQASTITSYTFEGSNCGVSASRRYILVHFHDGDGSAELDNDEQATFDLGASGAILTSGSSTCAAAMYTTQDPPIVFTIRNDPTRGSTVFEDGVTTGPIDARFFTSTPSITDGVVELDAAIRLHHSGETELAPKKAMRGIFIGTGVPKTGAGYRFPASNLASMCSNIPVTFESDIVTGPVTVDSLHAAIFVDGAYASQPSATLWYGVTDAADDDAGYSEDSAQDLDMDANPFYPANGAAGIVISESWQALAASNTGSDLCYVGETEATNNKYCAKFNIGATLAQLRACKNFDGTNAFTSRANADGTTTYTFDVTSQIFTYAGTNPTEGLWADVQTVSQTVTVSFDTSLAGSVSTSAAAAGVTSSIQSVASESCSVADCDYTAFSYAGIPSDQACDCGGSCPSTAEYRRLVITLDIDVDRTSVVTGGEVGIRDTNHVAFAPADQTGKETCYGLETSAALSSVTFDSTHSAVSTKNRFRAVYRTGCVNMYSQGASANIDTGFQSCSSAAYKDNFDIKIYLSQLETPGEAWGVALAKRLGPSAYRDLGAVNFGVSYHWQAPIVAASIGTDETAEYTATQLRMYRDPDYQKAGSWLQESSVSALSATISGEPVSFMETDWVVLAHELTSPYMKDILTLHIKEVHFCTLNPNSKYYNCLHPGSEDPANDVGLGALVTQVACPTGSNADLQYNCNAGAWNEFIGSSPSGSNISPISDSWDFVRNFVETAPWSEEGDAEQAFLCRKNVKTTAQQNVPGSTSFFCGDYADTDHYCGTASSSFESSKQSGRTAETWSKLAGFGAVDSTPFLGADAVKAPLKGMVTREGEILVGTVESIARDCDVGSEHDGGRRLRASNVFSSPRKLTVSEPGTSTGSTASEAGAIAITISVAGDDSSGLGGGGDGLAGGAIVLIVCAGFFVLCVGCSLYAGGKKRKRHECNNGQKYNEVGHQGRPSFTPASSYTAGFGDGFGTDTDDEDA